MDDVALQAAGVLVFIDQHMIEILGQALRQCRRLHHHMPIKQQIIEIQGANLLFARHVFAVQPSQIGLPLLAPGKLLLERLLERQPGIDAIRINGEAGVLARKALRPAGVSQLAAYDIHDVRRIGAVQHGEVRLESKMFGVEAQYAAADRMKRSAPQQARHDAAIARLAAIRQDFRDDGLGALDHFLRRTAREGQHEDARRIRAVQHQVRGSMRQGVGLAGARARQNQQGTGTHALVRNGGAKGRRAALTGIERVKGVLLGFHHRRSVLYVYPDPDATCAKLHGASRVGRRRARRQITQVRGLHLC